MRRIGFLIPLGVWLFSTCAHAQIHYPHPDSAAHVVDSIYIQETEGVPGKDKVLHAEPLFMDLVRDLGTRKGEREVDLVVGLTDYLNYDKNTYSFEYEFAPFNRLGMEIEGVYSLHYTSDSLKTTKPMNRIEGFRSGVQYSFFVSEKLKTSMSLGYLNEWQIKGFNEKGKFIQSHTSYPNFIAAKRWGSNFHTMLYALWKEQYNNNTKYWTKALLVNYNFHYMIPGTRNFIGVEVNSEISNQFNRYIIRPQMRVSINQNLLVGVVFGVPANKKDERFSMFLRLIYEPKRAHA